MRVGRPIIHCHGLLSQCLAFLKMADPADPILSDATRGAFCHCLVSQWLGRLLRQEGTRVCYDPAAKQ